MKQIHCRTEPCESCPYRKDAPPGLWHESEYRKLIEYDKPTGEQPPKAFFCHTTPDFLCIGWSVVHGRNAKRGYESLALRFLLLNQNFLVIHHPKTPLFKSGQEAAEHGMSAMKRPPRKTLEAAEKINAMRMRRAKRGAK